MCRFEVKGGIIEAMAQPYRFYLLNRVQTAYAALELKDRESVDDLLQQSGLQGIMNLSLSRGIKFQDNVEVWE
jgi:hypothetical protein